MPRSWIWFGLAALAFGAPWAVSADPIYRWVDAQGVVNYGSRPPETGPESKSVRPVVTEPAVVVHDTPQEKAQREKRAMDAQIAEEARLRRALLEEQIEVQRAQAEALRSQAAAAQAQAPYACDDGSADCYGFGYPVYFARRLARPRPAFGPRGPAHPAEQRVAMHAPGRTF
jgi:hypothetical protein